ncbi:hypothetical protein KY363_07455 [Candidatus Woesearchaeota archaeon]|nr:hypothetical protein [Candidatus Woesearchaeota archaeon]
MRKAIILISILAVMLALAGCSGNKEQTGALGSKFVGGKEGLYLSFASGSIPDKVLDQNQPFGISVVITNKGDYTIEQGSDATVKITGIDPADFGVSASDLTQDAPSQIRGAQKDADGNAIQGETVSLDFPASGSSLTHQKEIAGSVTYNVRADVCYTYGTVVNTKLCVLSDILGTQGATGKLCAINEDKTVDNSGAPVQVSSFRESVSSATKVAFVFTVKHVGTGTVHEKASECSKDFQKKDKVHVKIDTGLSDGISCSGLASGTASGSVYEGDAQLLNGEREIRCTQTVNNPTDLEKLVRIDLTYDYDQYIEKNLEVQHVGG